MIVALYAHASPDRQRENEPFASNQISRMRALCEAQGFSVATEYIETEDTDTEHHTPMFKKMISEATEETVPYDAIIVSSCSGPFQHEVTYAIYKHHLGKHGVDLIDVDQRSLDETFSVKILRLVLSSYEAPLKNDHILRDWVLDK
ncbi:Resolvase, N terminal domain [Malonomonas rubra DSM 5091]|uniref:Resolvase, N terminal domain n=2 Tax=Malonomonas rubra TaxID=57040 RepID=A0A1M6L6J5_MALRU|nr:Resolvase, N terminal domain [Malonomonas rubra DSM 5091]